MGWLVNQFESSRGTVSHHVRAMEGMRGFAVFLVFLVHFITLASPWIVQSSELSVFAGAIRTIGNSGVDLFFILSGYLIYGSLITRPQAFVTFMRRRVIRIYPAFSVVLAIYIYLSFTHPSESRIPHESYNAWIYALQNFLLFPGVFNIKPIITVAWSLSYEMLFYLIVPVTIFLLSMRERNARWRIQFVLGIGAIFIIYCTLYSGHLRFIMFIAGILLHEAMQTRNNEPRRNMLGPFALICGLMVTTVPSYGAGTGSLKFIILAASYFIACYCCFQGQSPILVRIFTWTPLRWLGNMSYSYYLLHGLTLKAGFTVVFWMFPTVEHETFFVFSLLPLMFATTLIPTIALFVLVERPCSLKDSSHAVTA